MAKKNLFKEAKAIQKQHPRLSWQDAIQKASAARKKGTKKVAGKKVGAYKVIEKGESRSAKPKKVVQVKRSAKGTFKGYSAVNGIAQKSLSEINYQLLRKKHLEGYLQQLKDTRPKTTRINSEMDKTRNEIAAVKKFITQLKRSI